MLKGQTKILLTFLNINRFFERYYILSVQFIYFMKDNRPVDNSLKFCMKKRLVVGYDIWRRTDM